ncbi:uncharacterized protein LOC132394945 [Hypanus sabinus]|uniref:uncharacterized protein LOC132394945 n=1 Tax=Hypanus sabinus TaxID=79690 RepID=UPI0028C40023|nr:uncharacterized protein LOC132394945 [Hypanus sabinus]
MQSSTEYSADANRAIDGNKDADARHNSCSQTKESSFPWWVLDLEGTCTVETVIITVRKDCCTERLLGAEVYIASSMESENNHNSLCGTVYSITGRTSTFHCALTPVRYVYITIPGHRRVLSLCEVEVFGSRVPSSSIPAINVAIKGTAVQSSVEYNGIASRAIDGNRNAADGSCTQTTPSTDPWWRLDLKQTYAVSMVKIINRLDCCSDRIKGARILIGDSLENNGNSNHLCATVLTVKQGYHYICEGCIGRYVNIMVPGPNRVLSLCEVEVFGTRLLTVEGTGRLKPALKPSLYLPERLCSGSAG